MQCRIVCSCSHRNAGTPNWMRSTKMSRNVGTRATLTLLQNLNHSKIIKINNIKKLIFLYTYYFSSFTKCQRNEDYPSPPKCAKKKKSAHPKANGRRRSIKSTCTTQAPKAKLFHYSRTFAKNGIHYLQTMQSAVLPWAQRLQYSCKFFSVPMLVGP